MLAKNRLAISFAALVFLLSIALINPFSSQSTDPQSSKSIQARADVDAESSKGLPPYDQSEGERAPVLPTLTPGQSTIAAPQGLTGLSFCLTIADDATRRVCVEECLARIPADMLAHELGSAICRTLSVSPPKSSAVELLVLVMPRWRNRSILGELDSVFGACPMFQVGDFITIAVKKLRDLEPELFELILSEIVSTGIYADDRTTLPVILSAEMGLVTGSEPIRDMLMSGAQGLLGGSSSQIDLSSLVVVRFLTDAASRVDFVRSIIDSPMLPGEVAYVGMGSSLMHIVTEQGTVTSIKGEDLLGTVLALIDHPILGVSAAAHIKGQLSLKPLGCDLDDATWQQVYEHALVVLGE